MEIRGQVLPACPQGEGLWYHTELIFYFWGKQVFPFCLCGSQIFYIGTEREEILQATGTHLYVCMSYKCVGRREDYRESFENREEKMKERLCVFFTDALLLLFHNLFALFLAK